MTANLKRYTIGERVKSWPANTWNRMVDSAERVIPIGPPGELGGATQNLIPAKNISTTGIPKGGVMMPTGSLLDVSDGDSTASYGAMVVVDVPDLSAGAEATYMIAVSPVDPGVIGSGILSGPVWARVDIRDILDKYAQVIDGDATKLESTASGSRARIISKESGTGEVWALILLAPYRLRIRKGIVNNTAGQTQIAAGGSGTVTVYQGGSSVGEENTWNLDWLFGSNPLTQNISTDVRAIAADFEEEGIFTIIAADCEPEPSAAPPGHGDTVDASATDTLGEGQLNYRVNRVTTTSGSPHVITLMDVDQGEDCIVRNESGSTLKCYPEDAGSDINNTGAGTAVTIANGVTARFHKVQDTEWVF
jgi:hypothetical protein